MLLSKILPKKSPSFFQALCDMLRETGNEYIVDAIGSGIGRLDVSKARYASETGTKLSSTSKVI